MRDDKHLCKQNPPSERLFLIHLRLEGVRAQTSRSEPGTKKFCAQVVNNLNGKLHILSQDSTWEKNRSVMQKLYSTWYTDCRASPALYQSHAVKASFITPLLQKSEADRSNIFQVTQGEIRTELPHYKPVPSPLQHCPILLVSSSMRTQPDVLDWLCLFNTPIHKQHFIRTDQLTSKVIMAVTACYGDLQ